MRYLVRPKPKSDESLESFMLRVARGNGYSNFSTFIQSLKISVISSSAGRFESFLPEDIASANLHHSQISSRRRIDMLRQFADLSGCELSDLLDICVARGAVTFSKRRVSLYRQGVNIPLDELLPLHEVPVCPLCINENGYGRQLWHFRSYTACQQHGIALINHCHCGASLNMVEQEFSDTCHQCRASLLEQTEKASESELKLSAWLSGEATEHLPSVAQSHRWGLVHWFRHYVASDDCKAENSFLSYFKAWPDTLFEKLKSDFTKAIELAVSPLNEMTFQDVFGDLLLVSCRLPGSALAHNIVLRSIVQFLSDEVIDKGSLLGELAINSIEAAILLNTTTEQIASLYDQGILQTKHQLKSSQIAAVTSPVFRLSDVLCCWLTSYQSETSNRRYLVSKW